MLDCFPGGQQAQAVESPGAKAREMFVGVAERKGAADERDLAVVRKIRGEIGAAVGVGHLAIAAQVDPAQDDAPAALVNEPSPIQVEPRQIHPGHWFNPSVFGKDRGQVDAMSDRPSSCTTAGLVKEICELKVRLKKSSSDHE